MFSLLITIIAIALVTALALATIYYGGTAFRQGSTAATASQFINEGQQVRAALTLYESATGAAANDIGVLVTDHYLTALPAGWDLVDGFTYRPTNDQSVCLVANQKVGIPLIPSCSDATYASTAPCCSSPA